MPNRLVSETSPYLLQHANNPVDWYPWGETALSRAQQEARPILLSIGYSACHWCHVMERECFQNQEIARIMNENFISIKVDREERPDLDAIYMEAVQSMTGSGGWPLTVFLTPQGKPFYGGTYFPPEERPGLISFPRLLQTVAHTYKTSKGKLEIAAEQLIVHLRQAVKVQRSLEPLNTGMLSKAYISVKSLSDPQNGGFGSAPKFPQPMVLEFLLRYHYRSGDQDALLIVEHTLEQMAKGGIYDQIGGGFHRYSVDDRWLVPHFEKMLYDNALLSRLYLHTYLVTGKHLYRRIAQETLDYILRQMRDREGGFYSSQDADSGGVEGEYYIWTPGEIAEVLAKDDVSLVGKYFGVTEQGNFDGKSILSQAVEDTALASELGISAQELEDRMATAKTRLRERRAKRPPPHRDEKILADWNGLMLASLAEAASVLDREDYREAATANATFLMRALHEGKLLKHSSAQGQAKGNGYLQDYALIGEGLLSLYEATLQQRWLQSAIELANTLLVQFWDESHRCFYDIGKENEELVIRPRNIYDNALPSGASAAAFLLLRLAKLTGNSDYERQATVALRSVQELMLQHPLGFGHWLCTLDFYLSPTKEIALFGKLDDPSMKSLLSVVNQRYLPNKVLAARDPEAMTPALDIPLLQNRAMLDNKPTAYLCQGQVCLAPVTDPDALAVLLDK